jgi:uncharacterized protein YutE (UPF0331/DUF86 family)
MVDVERLTRLLTRVRQDVATLRGHAEAERDELPADEVRLAAVKYVFVTLLEGCIDAAQHICASEGYGPPDSNADAMLVLARNDVLSDEVAETMADGVRFRNVLVHLYADVDDGRVVAHLDQLDEVERYVAELTGLLETEPS